MAKEINIKLKTDYDGSGAEKAKKHINGIADGFSKIGEALGGANSNLGRFMQNFLKGGIWGAAAELVGWGIKKVREWATASERAEKEAARASKETHDERMKHLTEYAAASEKLARTRNAAESQHLKMVNDEIDATKELTKATLELEKAEARKRGDTGRMAEIDREMDNVEAEAARAKLESEIESARNRRQGGRKDYSRAFKGRDSANIEVRRIEAIMGDRIAAIVEEARESAKGEAMVMQSSAGAVLSYAKATETDKRAAAKSAVAAFKGTDEYKALAEQLKQAKEKAAEFKGKMDEAKQSIAEAEKAEQNLVDRLEAVNIREEAKRKNKEAETAEAKAETARKTAEALKQAEIKAAQDAAREREQLEREAHKRRMDNLRELIAAENGRRGVLHGVAASAQSEFDRAFAMYRDPSLAAAQIGEEKDYQNDLAQLHKDAAGYGGKWRIDELSRLMAAGDSQGITDTLTAWRKNRNFTPQLEAMVRASAAEKTKTTAEDELRKIEHNTANLAAKLQELLTMKG
jgi:hypothetical protein